MQGTETIENRVWKEVEIASNLLRSMYFDRKQRDILFNSIKIGNRKAKCWVVLLAE